MKQGLFSGGRNIAKEIPKFDYLEELRRTSEEKQLEGKKLKIKESR